MLVDTSVWVDHLRKGNAVLAGLLETEDVWIHPFVIEELACGTLRQKSTVLSLLLALPRAPLADPDRLIEFVSDRALEGQGLGCVDVHILASASMLNLPLWTLDKKLARTARTLGLD